MKIVCVTLKCGEFETRKIAGTFRHCQSVLYAAYGRLNIAHIQFYIEGRWINSPYGVRRLEERQCS